jgi:hypothetical protein
MFSDICQENNCNKKASRITSKPEGGIIDVCSDCWNDRYKT